MSCYNLTTINNNWAYHSITNKRYKGPKNSTQRNNTNTATVDGRKSEMVHQIQHSVKTLFICFVSALRRIQLKARSRLKIAATVIVTRNSNRKSNKKTILRYVVRSWHARSSIYNGRLFLSKHAYQYALRNMQRNYNKKCIQNGCIVDTYVDTITCCMQNNPKAKCTNRTIPVQIRIHSMRLVLSIECT